IAKDIIDYNISVECSELLQQVKRGDDPPAGTAYAGLRTSRFHTPDPVVPGKNNVRQGECSFPPGPDEVHHGRDELSLHQHPRAVPLGIAADLEDREPPGGECGREIG